MTRLTKVEAQWNDLASLDPMWAVLTTPEGQHSKWNREEFFATGRADIRNFLAETEKLGLRSEWKDALDFGCGLGRVTSALQEYVPHCAGIDISEKMLAQARSLHPQCEFVLNKADDLAFPDCSYDLVFSLIALQHLGSQKIVLSYLREFARVLRPGGLLAFQLPSKIPFRQRLAPRRRMYELLRRIGFSADFLYKRLNLFSMYLVAIPEHVVIDALHSCGLRFVYSRPDGSAGSVPSRMYYFTRP
jgi:SAM-dependent methyltransferase